MANAWAVIMLTLLVGIGVFGLLGVWVPVYILLGVFIVGIVVSMVVQARSTPSPPRGSPMPEAEQPRKHPDLAWTDPQGREVLIRMEGPATATFAYDDGSQLEVAQDADGERQYRVSPWPPTDTEGGTL